jgi:phosphatidylglycerophosphatase A
VWAADVVAKHRGVSDPSIVVVDEVLGQWIALAGAPRFSWLNVGLAFVLFRAFDIVKPPPAPLPNSGVITPDVDCTS